MNGLGAGPQKEANPIRLPYVSYMNSMDNELLFNWLATNRLYRWPEWGRFPERSTAEQRRNTAANLHMVEGFRKLAKCLEVPVMPIKGLYLLDGPLLRDWHLRRSEDMDLLLRERDFRHVATALEEAGYKLSAGRVPAPLGSHFDVFSREGHVIDMHLRLSILPSDSMKRLLPREGTCHGVPCLLPDPSRHLHYLAWHLLKHLLDGLGRPLTWADEFFRLYLPQRSAIYESATARQRMRLRLLEAVFLPTSPSNPGRIELLFSRLYSPPGFLPLEMVDPVGPAPHQALRRLLKADIVGLAYQLLGDL